MTSHSTMVPPKSTSQVSAKTKIPSPSGPEPGKARQQEMRCNSWLMKLQLFISKQSRFINCSALLDLAAH